jgi:general secretion pathway protein A
MYERHFGLTERPFSLTPDPGFMYRGRKHGMALTMLEYGLMSDSPIVVITGEIGAGKTTLIRQLLNQLDDSVTVGLISNTHKAFGELLQWICLAFGLESDSAAKVELYRKLVDFLIGEYAKGKKTILIVDEAQNMDAVTLEELRVLSNINADKNVVLQLVLSGQPELRETLRLPELEQFAQRIATDYHLDALDLRETREYILHRVSVAGGNRSLFLPDAIIAIFQYSAGVPRLINSICDTALVYAFADGRARVTGKLVHEMVAEKRSRGLFGAGKYDYGVSAHSESKDNLGKLKT